MKNEQQQLTKKNQYRIDWTKFSSSQEKKVLYRTGASKQYLKDLKEATATPIKDFPEEAARGAVLSMVYLCTSVYLSVDPKKIDNLLLQKMTSIIVSKFPTLSVKEIDKAFELAATGTLKVDTTSYYGRFNINAITALLIAYKQYRSKVIAEVEREVEAAEKEAREAVVAEERNKIAVAGAIKQVNTWLDMASEGFLAFEEYKEIPSITVEQAYRNKGFKSDEDKTALYEEAKVYAKRAIQKRTIDSYSKNKTSLLAVKNIAKAIKEGAEIRGAKEKAQVIFFQLLLWNKLKELAKNSEDES
jgi:hypothetical protein